MLEGDWGWVKLGRSPRLDAKVPVPTKHAMRALEARRSRNMIVYCVAKAEVRIQYRKPVCNYVIVVVPAHTASICFHHVVELARA